MPVVTETELKVLMRLFDTFPALYAANQLTELPDYALIVSDVGDGSEVLCKEAGQWYSFRQADIGEVEIGAECQPTFPALLLLPKDAVPPRPQPSPRARARRSDPDTSHQAAASLSSDRLRTAQSAVLACLRRHGPMTDEDLVVRYDGVPQSPSGLRTRRDELVRRGLVVDTGDRRPTVSGRSAKVWAAVR